MVERALVVLGFTHFDRFGGITKIAGGFVI
jgi:hypothetical protein